MESLKDGYWQTSKAGVNYVNHRTIVPSLSSYHPEGLGQNYPVKFIFDEKKGTYLSNLGSNTAHSAESWLLSSKSSIPLNVKNQTSLSSSPKQTENNLFQ